MSENEKKVPKRRFREFENAEGWEQRKLGNIVDIRSGKDYKHLSEGKIPVYGTGGYMLSVNEALSYKEDAIGIGRKGTIDKPYILRAPFWTVDTLFYGIPETNNDIDFIYDIFQNINWKQKDESTGVPSLSKTAINDVDVLVPEYKEQKKIGNFFQNIDNLITIHHRKLEKMKALKKAYLKDMFPAEGERKPKVRFVGFTDDWEQRKLGDLISYIVDNRGKNPKYYCNEGIPVIDNFMIKNNCYPNLKEATRFIDDYLFDNFVRKYNEVDDILITLVGNGIGNITLFPKGKSVIIQNTLGLRFSNNKKFMFYSLLSKNKQIVSLDRGMAQPSIRQDELLDIELELPSDMEQTKISEFFYNLDNLIKHHQRKLEKLQNIKKAYLNEMFI